MTLARTNTFSGLSLLLDRLAERRDELAWVAEQATSPESRFLLLDNRGTAYMASGNATLRWLNAEERALFLPEVAATFLGIVNERPHFLLTVEDSTRASELEEVLGASRMGLREAGLELAADEAGLFAYAKGLSHWQRETRFCAYCGSTLTLVSSGHRAQCTHVDCGRTHFPRTDAAIIVIVEHEGACLLGRQAGWPPGRYSTLAGFIEPGESLEDAVRREVAEESGVIVGDVHYHSSQPWPMPASLMVGFTAKAIDPTIRLRDGELEDARWFTPQEIADGLADGSLAVPTKLSVSYQLLASWLRERANLDLDSLATLTPWSK